MKAEKAKGMVSIKSLACHFVDMVDLQLFSPEGSR